MNKILVTGAAGFIGFHTALRLINEGHIVVGLDNLNDYYDVNLKFGRLNELGIEASKSEWDYPVESTKYDTFTFYRTHLENTEVINTIFEKYTFDHVVHLAAQAGVRYSLTNPHAYIDSNIKGFLNILEACRHNKPKHLIYASSSSVYGANTKIPFEESDSVDHPVSLYAATKKANELMAHTYSHLFGIPTTGLRFFTVYGPWGRPDMAVFLFTKAIWEGKPINVYNNGEMMRDFTYIDDIVEGIYRLVDKPAKTSPLHSSNQPRSDIPSAPYRIFNIGNSKPVLLMDFIKAIEEALGKKANMNMMGMQPGDVIKTWASAERLNQAIDYQPITPIPKGIKLFIDWYMGFYRE